MAIQTAAAKSKYVPVTIPVNSPDGNLREHLQSQIAARAYELYQQSGENHGNDLLNWVQAESEIVTRVSEVQESSSWYTVNVPLRDIAADDLQVRVEPTHAIIAARKSEKAADGERSETAVHGTDVFLYVKWPTEVDPSTASSYLQNQTLNLTAKSALPAGNASPESVPSSDRK